MSTRQPDRSFTSGSALRGLRLARLGDIDIVADFSLLRQALFDLTLRDIMDVHVSTVPPDHCVQDLVCDRTWKRDQPLPVTRDGVLLGMVDPEQLRAVPHERRADVCIAEVMTPVSNLRVMTPATSASELLEAMNDQDTIPVVERTRLVGIARREDLGRWFAWNSSATA